MIKNLFKKDTSMLGYNIPFNEMIDDFIKDNKHIAEYKKYVDEILSEIIDEDSSNYKLEDKINLFYNWFCDYSEGEYLYNRQSKINRENELRNFVEKMAIWYELRYPEYEINRLMPCIGQEKTKINDVMFNDNEYVMEQFDEESDIRILDWDKFYNFQAFYNSLPYHEKRFLSDFEYRMVPPELTIDDNTYFKIFLTLDGTIERIKHCQKGLVGYQSPYLINNKFLDTNDLIGKNIIYAEQILMNKYNCTEEQLKDIEQAIKSYTKHVYIREELLNCVMYRIIERGGNRIGPRRAFLFAKEFGRNIEIPLKYGIDYTDPDLREFVNEYIKAGGSKELLCYVGYFEFSKYTNNELMTVSIEEVLKKTCNACLQKYTEEENALHLRLVNAFAYKANEEIKK